MDCKGNMIEWRGSLQSEGESSARYTSDRGFVSKIYKELKKLNALNTNNQVKNLVVELNRVLRTKNTVA